MYLTFPSLSIANGSHHEALGLHFVMFLPTLYSQCDPQQSRKWIPLAESFQVVGTYAQTEMGHGQSRTESFAHFSFDWTSETNSYNLWLRFTWGPVELLLLEVCCDVCGMCRCFDRSKPCGMSGFMSISGWIGAAKFTLPEPQTHTGALFKPNTESLLLHFLSTI